MRGFQSLTFTAAALLLQNACATLVPAKMEERSLEWVVKPKIFIISMFDPEAEVWDEDGNGRKGNGVLTRCYIGVVGNR